MAYLGTKPANQVIDSTLIADGTITPADLSTGKPVWDTSGNLGVGTSSPTAKLESLYTSTTPSLSSSSGTGLSVRGSSSVRLNVGSYPSSPFATWMQASDNANSSYDVVINPLGGNLLVGASSIWDSNYRIHLLAATGTGVIITKAIGANHVPMAFTNSSNGNVGFISSTNTATSYSTTSDYRLKENVLPIIGALDIVQQLNPVTYNWKIDGSSGQGFIAHELQAVVPDCVTGEKDAVEIVDELDAEGKVIGTKEVPQYQGIDTSFLVATLTAAIQELKAELYTVKAEVATLKGTA